LDPLEKARGKIDKAIKAKYLNVVKHLNIVEMRAGQHVILYPMETPTFWF
jgi:hypothetical protein